MMQKLYYSISEISEILGEEQHILRYWEKEFKTLRPRKNSAGNRKYSNKDLEVLKKIKNLIRVEKLTIGLAKDVIDKNIPYNSNGSQEALFMNGRGSNIGDSINVDKDTIKEILEVLKDISKALKS